MRPRRFARPLQDGFAVANFPQSRLVKSHAHQQAHCDPGKSRTKNKRLIQFVVGKVFVFIKQTFLFPRLVNSATADLEKEESCREKPLSQFQDVPQLLPLYSAVSQEILGNDSVTFRLRLTNPSKSH
jgi:hypothetical protein